MGREPGLHTDAGLGQQQLHWRDRAPIGLLGLSHTRQQGLRIRDSLALMNKTHEVCSFQNGFSNKNRTGVRVCDAIFNHRREEVGAGDGRTPETVPCQGTPRGGHIALRLLWGWTGDLLEWLWGATKTDRGHLSLGGAAGPYSTVHTPSTVGR